LTVSSFTSASLDPPLVLICLGHRVGAIDAFRASAHFGINVLAENQRDLAERFSRKGQDRFDGLNWRRGSTGVPILAGVLAAIECAVRQRFTAGDHDVFVGQMVAARVAGGAPLIHFASRYHRLDASR
jgi:flavin reductase (DIM6/NTAB) family NADH-FMN oxidoreductase RutF